jgi:acetyl esterase/lipase
LPYSSLASEQAKKHFIDFVQGFKQLRSASVDAAGGSEIERARKLLDGVLMRPGVERLQAAFPVSIIPGTIGGVQTDVIVPQGGIAPQNSHRVLLNLHGGAFAAGARYGGQQESIPIASLGKIKVITIDYRMGPEHKFPAASEDVAAVYEALLKHYRPQNIGIYGCSAGGMLTAQSVAWFQSRALPRPGAIGILGAGAVIGKGGDSNVLGSLFTGGMMPGVRDADTKKVLTYFSEADLDDPLVSPARSAAVLSRFPPTLLISGTRDQLLSNAAYTHTQMVKANVDADLHVWEGAPHCSFAQPVVDPDVPETREAWNVIVRFFDKHLGSKQ